MTSARARAFPIGLLLGALIAGGVTFVGLALASQPANGQARMAAVRSKAETARTLTKQGAGSDTQAAALCTGEIGKAAGVYRSLLSRLASSSGVELTQSQVAENPAGEDELSSAGVSLSARGSQEADLAFLQAVGGETPTLLVRRIDLQPREGMVELSLEGAIWCVR